MQQIRAWAGNVGRGAESAEGGGAAVHYGWHFKLDGGPSPWISHHFTHRVIPWESFLNVNPVHMSSGLEYLVILSIDRSVGWIFQAVLLFWSTIQNCNMPVKMYHTFLFSSRLSLSYMPVSAFHCFFSGLVRSISNKLGASRRSRLIAYVKYAVAGLAIETRGEPSKHFSIEVFLTIMAADFMRFGWVVAFGVVRTGKL